MNLTIKYLTHRHCYHFATIFPSIIFVLVFISLTPLKSNAQTKSVPIHSEVEAPVWLKNVEPYRGYISNGNGKGSGGGIGSARIWEPYYMTPSNCSTSNYSPAPNYEPDITKSPYKSNNGYIRHQPPALYTKKAWVAGTEGSIKLKVVLLADGTVGKITPLNQLPNDLTDSAVRAACYITFDPAINTTGKAQHPINSTKVINYQFQLSQAFSPEEYSYEEVLTAIPFSIISKPTAAYTDEAQQEGVDGVVTLRVTFLASGEIGAIVVVSGLPYGLTDEAIKAARNIKFNPQVINGVPKTVTKMIQYKFKPN